MPERALGRPLPFWGNEMENEGLTVEKLRAARDMLMSAELEVGELPEPVLVQVRFPRSRRRRIREKWERDWRNFRVRWFFFDENDVATPAYEPGAGLEPFIIDSFFGRGDFAR